jgi:phosphoribosylanthranilate isomerase
MAISFQSLGMLITKVKVSKITNLSEARYCAGMGVDFLSFPSSNVDPKTYQEITGWVAGPMFGVEIDSHPHEQYTTDFFEVPFDSIDKLPVDKKAFVHLSVNEWSEKKSKLIEAKEKIIAIELSIHSIDDEKKIIEEVSNEFDVFLKHNHSLDIESILKLPIAGISLEGSSEVRSGLKEYPLAEILEQLEIEH